jgi:alpha-mannosidase
MRAQNLTFDWNGGQIQFDSERCAVKSLVDAHGRDWIPQGSGPAFGEFVHTSFKTRAQKTAVFPESQDRLGTITARRLQCYREPAGVHVFADFDRNGFCVSSKWLFRSAEPWIDVTYQLQGGWTDDPQTVQIAFPLTLRKPVYRYDAPGAILAAAPKSQGGDDLPGANPRLFAGLTFASASAEDRGLVLLTPDTHLLEFGADAIRAPGYECASISAQIASMPMMNLTGNDWQFGQAGRRDWTFRYRVVLCDGAWDPMAPLVAAQQFGTPPFLQVPGVESCMPGLASLQIDFRGGPTLACKTAEDGERLVVRLWNVRNEACHGSLKLPPGFQRAERCDALERPQKGALQVSDGRVHFDASPRSIVTIALCRD